MILALALLLLVNDYRAGYDLPPLLPSAHLTEAAQYHAENMTSLTHVDSLGRGPFERIGDYGFTSDRRGEVLAWGSRKPTAIVDAWRNSPGHNSVILDSEFTVVGIGVAGSYWVVDLGGCRSCPKTYPTWRW